MLKITLHGLAAERGGTLLVPPQDLALSAGQGLIITGDNGAGKSTFLRVIAGLLPSAAGHITIDGAMASDGEPATRCSEICHYVGHRNGMKPHMSVRANLSFWQKFLQSDDARAIDAALLALNLFDFADLPFGYLSAGQQRRVALCRLLVAPRKLWLLDEPTNALDAASQELFFALIGAHLTAGGIVMAATHQPLQIADARKLVLTRAQPDVDAFDEGLWL
ncbi:heme ABC exporter ATP-binding protein CcmA [Aureimonas fodinaquatilis]|uniref:Heme ABC exporter ATP-binding protein CcmA n=1 Tax=Aureimonas fodinaquatilis TaxID=2565783 RepID=A0A5B0DTF0_9HYPH|nr:heme ABC exporter ATP-binding protein CcmA [Aureimonas fodinaquatilis]KAA0969716.1 heme ABC exporter ATP-binding protein CcmA [Aureimonas fodinaquatilis]